MKYLKRLSYQGYDGKEYFAMPIEHLKIPVPNSIKEKSKELVAAMALAEILRKLLRDDVCRK